MEDLFSSLPRASRPLILRESAGGEGTPMEGGAAATTFLPPPSDDATSDEREGGTDGESEGGREGRRMGGREGGREGEREGGGRIKKRSVKRAAPAGEPAEDASALAEEEAMLPLWMRKANARVIKPLSPPMSALGLHPQLLACLADKGGVRHAFPVQATVVPIVLAAHAAGCPGDLCVCAPTGSGKTLAYVLPILHSLADRLITRLRALVLVPTRGLAAQVFDVFSSLCTDGKLKVGLAAGQADTSWDKERRAIVGEGATGEGGKSMVDVLVATPGRLVEHLHAGGGFTLQHLQFLVVDEADRLLSQGYQGWLHQVLDAAHRKPPCGGEAGEGVLPSLYSLEATEAVEPLTTRPLVGSWQANARSWIGYSAIRTPLIKLLFSATLTRNPSKLAPLKLVCPRYFAVSGSRYATPSTLREWSLTCDREEKPALLLLLLRWMLRGCPKEEEGWGWGREEERSIKQSESLSAAGGRASDSTSDGESSEPEEGKERGKQGGEDGEEEHQSTAPPSQLPQTLVFASSLDATQRLTALLSSLGYSPFQYSSAMPRKQRNATLARLKDGSARLVVASDALARGMDVDTVRVVINYDPPADVKGYVHRVGRTARAGREGTSYTLLADREVHHFKSSMAKAGKEWRPLKLPCQRRALRELRGECESALEDLALTASTPLGPASEKSSVTAPSATATSSTASKEASAIKSSKQTGGMDEPHKAKRRRTLEGDRRVGLVK